MSPSGSTPNLSMNNSVSSLPQQWNSTTNLPPLGHSTPTGPSPARSNVPSPPTHATPTILTPVQSQSNRSLGSTEAGPRVINLQHYFPSSGGSNSAMPTHSSTIPSAATSHDHGGQHSTIPGPGGRTGASHTGYVMARNARELSEMMSAGHYQSPSTQSTGTRPTQVQ